VFLEDEGCRKVCAARNAAATISALLDLTLDWTVQDEDEPLWLLRGCNIKLSKLKTTVLA
jgi:hypothetical protein